MKTNKKNTNMRTAVEFIRSYEETQNIMESIANDTAKEQMNLMESVIANEDYTDDDGVFDMGSMLDVSISDEESNQPRYYNSPVEELTEDDKNLIIDEFTKMIKDDYKTVIDFSDIGPVATVIQDRFGFKQDIEGFLRDTVQKASDWQQSQKMAVDPATGTAGQEIAGVPTEEVGGPTDIEPDQEGITAGVEPTMDEPVMGAEEVVVEPVMEEPAMEEPVMGEPVEDDISLDGVEDALGEVEIGEGEETGEVEGGEELSEETVEDVADEVANDVVVDDEVKEELSEEIADEIKEEGEEAEEKEEGEEEEDEDEDEAIVESEIEALAESETTSVDAQLEAIKAKIDGSAIDTLVEAAAESLTTEETIDAQLEAIRSELNGTDTIVECDKTKAPLVEEVTDEEADEAAVAVADASADKKAKKMAMADIKKQLGDDIAELTALGEAEAEAKVTAQLESISANYHKAENAKVEAVKAEKKLDAQLEAIAASYKKGVTAKLEAAQKEAEVDAKLNGLVESYQDSQKANLEARKAAKEKIEKLSK